MMDMRIGRLTDLQREAYSLEELYSPDNDSMNIDKDSTDDAPSSGILARDPGLILSSYACTYRIIFCSSSTYSVDYIRYIVGHKVACCIGNNHQSLLLPLSRRSLGKRAPGIPPYHLVVEYRSDAAALSCHEL